MKVIMMDKLQKQSGKIPFVLIGIFTFLPKVFCGLQPYYLNFPPPILSVPNELGDFSYSVWPQNKNETSARSGGNLPSGPIPLVFHTWIKPDNSEGTKLQNGTVVYYLGGPWGGIRSSPPGEKPPSSHITPGGGGWSNPSLVDITTPAPPPQLTPPSRQETGPWGHGHYGFGWPSSTHLYDEIAVTTSVPARNQVISSSTTRTTAATTTSKTTTATAARTSGTTASTRSPASKSTSPATTTAAKTTTTTTTVDPIAENTNSRFPVSDSVRKFRRIVAQIRAITKKELGAEAREARREQRRRERLLRIRGEY